MELKTLNYFLFIPSYDLVFVGQVFPNCLYAPNSLKLYYSSFSWSWSLSDTSLNVKYGIEGFEIIFVCTHPHDLGYLIPASLNEPNNPNTLELAAPLPEFSLDLKCRIKNLRIFVICMHVIFQKMGKKRQERAKYLKIWAKMYKIWKHFGKGQPRLCKYQMHETARIYPGV